MITAGKEPGEYQGEYQDISQLTLTANIENILSKQIGGLDCDPGPAGARGDGI